MKEVGGAVARRGEGEDVDGSLVGAEEREGTESV
jgi:hypothetical protein